MIGLRLKMDIHADNVAVTAARAVCDHHAVIAAVSHDRIGDGIGLRSSVRNSIAVFAQTKGQWKRASRSDVKTDVCLPTKTVWLAVAW